MAIFHMHCKIIDRKSGRSIVAAAAYRSGENLYDERREQEQDYTKKTGVVHSEIMAPDNAPARFSDRQTLWNEVEKAEKRKDAQLAREVEVALPRELSQADQIALVREFVRENFTSEGMIADFSIHAPKGSDGKPCPHAHILLTLREVGPEGFGKKQREWNAAKVVTGEQHEPGRDWYERGTNRHGMWRASWEELTNRKLAERGIDARIDRRSYADRGIDLEPQMKEGAGHRITRKMKRKDPEALSETSAENRRVRARNWHRIENAPHLIAEALTARKSTFTKRDVAIFMHRYSDVADHQTLNNMMARVLADGGTVTLGRDQRGDTRYSTASMLRTESHLVEMAEAMRADNAHSEKVAHAAPMEGAKFFLSKEQNDAVAHITGRERLALVSGLAGAGKTTMLYYAQASWGIEGYEVRGLALAASAAAQLEEGSQIPSQTIASFLRGIEKGQEQIGARTVLVVDEAGMIGSHQMRDILSVAQNAGAKVVLVGDGEQLQAIEAGAPFRKLEERLGAARLAESRRARDAGDRAATVALGGGRTREGLEHYDRQGALVEVATAPAQNEAMARAYLADAAEIGAENVLVLAHRRADIRQLNSTIRAELVATGKVEAGVTLPTVNGDRDFGVGDRVVFLRNNKKLGVRNGMDGVVEAVNSAAMRIRTKEGGVIVTLDAYGHVDHGYARTLHKGQGATAERVHVGLSNTLDRQLAYVGLSRHRERVRAYWTPETAKDKEALFDTLCRDRRKDMALDYIEDRGIEPASEHVMRHAVETLLEEEERFVPAHEPTEAVRQLYEEEKARVADAPAVQSEPVPGSVEAVAQRLAAGQHLIDENELPALPGLLGTIMDRLPRVLGTVASPLEDAAILLQGLGGPETSVEPDRKADPSHQVEPSAVRPAASDAGMPEPDGQWAEIMRVRSERQAEEAARKAAEKRKAEEQAAREYAESEAAIAAFNLDQKEKAREQIRAITERDRAARRERRAAKRDVRLEKKARKYLAHEPGFLGSLFLTDEVREKAQALKEAEAQARRERQDAEARRERERREAERRNAAEAYGRKLDKEVDVIMQPLEQVDTLDARDCAVLRQVLTEALDAKPDETRVRHYAEDQRVTYAAESRHRSAKWVEASLLLGSKLKGTIQTRAAYDQIKAIVNKGLRGFEHNNQGVNPVRSPEFSRFVRNIDHLQAALVRYERDNRIRIPDESYHAKAETMTERVWRSLEGQNETYRRENGHSLYDSMDAEMRALYSRDEGRKQQRINRDRAQEYGSGRDR
ncbi:Ti-type conjugative transfer relaxase TraA [Asaia bogorensis]|uniref:Ti-type conjugative transfer relaxase TraA n=1 Tax=Asaia bogorensis TaxID=91915 RepID=UPI00301B2A81